MEAADARLRLRSVARLARVLAEPRPLLDLLELAGREIRFALGAAAVSVGRLERERGHVRILVNVGQLAAWEQERPDHEVYGVAELPMYAALVDELRSYTVDVNDPAADEATRILLGELGMGSAVAAPILLDGVVWGELWATRSVYEPPFEDGDREVAEALGAVLAAGIGQSDRLMQAERLIYTDSLTGLANRRAVDRALESALDRYAVDEQPVSVVMGDVNGLKVTNDQEGHAAGDALIKECARAVSKALHVVPGSLAGRIGGDEFCVVLDGYGLARAEGFAQEIQRQLARGPHPGAMALGVSSTESMPSPSFEAMTPRRLMRWADEAQYGAKRQATNTPFVAGRDVPLTEPVERRRHRREPVTSPRAAERSAIALDAALRALAAPDAPREPLDRLLLSLDAVVEALGAVGWIVGARDDRQIATVAFAAHRDGIAVDAVLPISGQDWEAAAAAAGVLSDRSDDQVPLAAWRGCGSVAAASAGAWWVEVLADPPATLDGVPAVLRSLVCVAVAG